MAREKGGNEGRGRRGKRKKGPGRELPGTSPDDSRCVCGLSPGWQHLRAPGRHKCGRLWLAEEDCEATQKTSGLLCPFAERTYPVIPREPGGRRRGQEASGRASRVGARGWGCLVGRAGEEEESGMSRPTPQPGGTAWGLSCPEELVTRSSPTGKWQTWLGRSVSLSLSFLNNRSHSCSL